MLRSYRIILEIDVEVESEDESGFDGIEEQLENINNWQAFCDDFDTGYVNHAEIHSFDVEWE